MALPWAHSLLCIFQNHSQNSWWQLPRGKRTLCNHSSLREHTAWFTLMSSVKQTDDPWAIYTSLRRQTSSSKWREGKGGKCSGRASICPSANLQISAVRWLQLSEPAWKNTVGKMAIVLPEWLSNCILSEFCIPAKWNSLIRHSAVGCSAAKESLKGYFLLFLALIVLLAVFHLPS